MASPVPFKIDVPEAKIKRLKQKLALTDYPSEADDAESWHRGPPLKDVKRLAARWEDGYDWRKAEAQLNRLSQFTTNIDIDNFGAFSVHFIHQRSHVANAIPLCFVHGWPGSFIEVTKIIHKLTHPDSPDQPAFHVVAPSLINFGFSSECIKPGFNVTQHAETCHKLMLQLGYDQYVTQGGDLGYFTTHTMARMYPDHLKAIHCNLAVPEKPDAKKHPELHAEVEAHTLTDREKRDLAQTRDVSANLMGYYRIQETRPALIAISHTDSPVGLLSWIYDVLYHWSDHDHYPWTDDEILTWVSIYYFGCGIAASVRIYYESRNMPKDSPAALVRGSPVKPLIGIAHFPVELSSFPRLWYRTMGNVVHQKEFDVGGHFAAYEQPDLLVGDLREMFGRRGGAEGCVPGKSGYDGADSGSGVQ
ncbi:putative epoxide hydrolase [Cyphellophora attinorum]|uniref:Putative epoxide hydrolase n=1 Tax=Cyphellophora attinorum TaxID=1664694 RepID=A0A0N1P1K7_9EURO|nr:putative epoxide hydrolase [Phialophora attinorum]KPI41967.1 putative epoxide hydrolase [Phialophora attinorum]